MKIITQTANASLKKHSLLLTFYVVFVVTFSTTKLETMFFWRSKPEQNFSSMSISDILKRALYLYRENFALLAGIVLPGWILIVFLVSLLGKVAFVSIPTFFSGLFVASAGTIAISKRMLNQNIKAGSAYKNVLNRIFPLLGSLVLSAVVMGFAFVLPNFVLPESGIISGSLCYVYLNLVPQVVMLEGEGGVGAMKRAKELIREYFKRSAILMVPPLILQIAIMILIYSVVELIHSPVLATMVRALFIVIVGTLTEPFKILISTLLYYDLRITKEGYDLKLMEKEIAGEI